MENIPLTDISRSIRLNSSRILTPIQISYRPSLIAIQKRSQGILNELNQNIKKSNNSCKAPLTREGNRKPTLITYPQVTATSWCIMDALTSQRTCGLNDSEVREIASLTKIMTCILCLNILKKNTSISMESTVKVSISASRMIGTSAFLKSGDKLTVKDLFYGLMLPSGNDAAWSLAEYFGSVIYPGSVKPVRHFIGEMNKLARELCLFSTSFNNPHGLMYKKNLSNAKDVASLACYALKNEKFREIVNTKSYTAKIRGYDGNHRYQIWENTNKLLGNGFNGVKTGITDGAGPCLCVSTKRKSSSVIVLLNSRSMEDRWIEAQRLSDWIITSAV